MEFLLYLLQRTWSWIANNGLSIAALLILVVLIPRIRRFVIAVATGNMSEGEESTKGRRALIGAVVYIVEMIAYFIVGIALLGQFGVSLTAAAVPATVVSAAIGFGAQGVIADLLGGVQTVQAGGVRMIPYYAWDNRAGGGMAVWLRETD